jgi:uroporphyrinogen decarboxylase
MTKLETTSFALEEIMAEMTNKERVEALLRREKPDRIPVYPFAMGFPVVYTQTDIADAYNKPEVAYAAQKKAAKDFEWVFFPQLAYASFGGWEFGGEIKWPGGDFAQAPTITKHVIDKPEQVADLQMPDIPNAGIIPIQKSFHDLASQDNDPNAPWPIVIHMEGTFTTAANIVGTVNFSKWILKKPDVVHQIMRLTTDFQKKLAEYWFGLYGTEKVISWGGDPGSSNQLISPKTFKEFSMPYVKEVHEKMIELGSKHIFKHICGEQNKNLEFWAQVPMGDPGFVSFGHEVDVERAAEYFPRDVVVGNLEPAIIATATPDDVYAATKAILEKGKKCSGGFMFAPGCELPPMSPLENIRAMTRAVQDHGWY